METDHVFPTSANLMIHVDCIQSLFDVEDNLVHRADSARLTCTNCVSCRKGVWSIRTSTLSGQRPGCSFLNINLSIYIDEIEASSLDVSSYVSDISEIEPLTQAYLEPFLCPVPLRRRRDLICYTVPPLSLAPSFTPHSCLYSSIPDQEHRFTGYSTSQKPPKHDCAPHRRSGLLVRSWTRH